MTALDATPHGVDLLAIRVGTTLARWGRERAARRIPFDDADPSERLRLAAELQSARAQREAGLPRIR